MSQSLNLTNAEALRAIATVAGFNRDPTTWDATQLTDARDIVRRGLRKFYNPPKVDGTYHSWRFLERTFSQFGPPTFSAGTIAISGGTVTLAGATWPSIAADSIIRVNGRTLYVTSVTDTTTLTVDNEGVSVVAGTEFTMHRWRFPLPGLFAEFIAGVVYDRGGSGGNGYGHKLRGSVDQDIKLRYTTQFHVGDTCMYAVVPGGENDAARWYMTFWPVADESATFTAVYREAPQDSLDNADLTADGTVVQVDAVHAETMLAAIQAAAEEFYNDAPGVHAQRYQTRLAASIDIDRHSRGPVDFPNDDRIDSRRLSLLSHVPTYFN